MKKITLRLFFISALYFIASTAYGQKLLPKVHLHFRRFMEDFHRTYADEKETQMRFDIFRRNLQRIDELNDANENAIFEITKFSDLTEEEKEAFLGYIPAISRQPPYDVKCEERNGNELKLELSKKAAPEGWDWREHGAVTRVKDQRNCGSCWAFGAAGNLEGQHAIKTGQLLQFSEQQLLDCVERVHMDCAHGGDMRDAIRYYNITKGAMSEEDYPYEAKVGQCRFEESKVKTTVKGCVDYNLQSEEVLKDILYSQGPLAVAIHATPLFDYGSGIFQNCTNTTGLNHAVLLVGYGTENSIPFWIVKNSWGEGYGEKGYFRIERGTNQCNLMKSDGHIINALL